MTYFIGILILLGLGLIALLSFPITIHVENQGVFIVRWIFLGVRISVEHRAVRTEVSVFNKTLKFRKKKKRKAVVKAAEKRSPKKPRKKKPTFSLAKEILQDKAVKSIAILSFRLILRIVFSFRIAILKWDIGLKDYYWQGVIAGLLAGLPRSKNFRIDGNFQEINNFCLVGRVSLWRILQAVFLFLFFFPYFGAFRVYGKIR